jgi:hypothetical protein
MAEEIALKPLPPLTFWKGLKLQLRFSLAGPEVNESWWYNAATPSQADRAGAAHKVGAEVRSAYQRSKVQGSVVLIMFEPPWQSAMAQNQVFQPAWVESLVVVSNAVPAPSSKETFSSCSLFQRSQAVRENCHRCPAASVVATVFHERF